MRCAFLCLLSECGEWYGRIEGRFSSGGCQRKYDCFAQFFTIFKYDQHSIRPLLLVTSFVSFSFCCIDCHSYFKHTIFSLFYHRKEPRLFLSQHIYIHTYIHNHEQSQPAFVAFDYDNEADKNRLLVFPLTAIILSQYQHRDSNHGCLF